MRWDLGLGGVTYLAAMAVVFGLVAQLLCWRVAPRWLWALVAGVYFGVGVLVSEVWFGWATEEDLQPNVDGLSRDEVLLIGLAPVFVAVVATRWIARRRALTTAGDHEPSDTGGRVSAGGIPAAGAPVASAEGPASGRGDLVGEEPDAVDLPHAPT